MSFSRFAPLFELLPGARGPPRVIQENRSISARWRADTESAPRVRVRRGLSWHRRARAIPSRAACTGPVEVKDGNLVVKAIERFRAALSGSNVEEGFLNAASPGVIAAFQNRSSAAECSR